MLKIYVFCRSNVFFHLRVLNFKFYCPISMLLNLFLRDPLYKYKKDRISFSGHLAVLGSNAHVFIKLYFEVNALQRFVVLNR
jgi:hypothetical protein